MKNSTGQLLSKKHKEILQFWMSQQLEDASLREDLMTNQDLRHESEELLHALLDALKKDNFVDIDASEFDKTLEGLMTIAAKLPK